MNGSFHANVSGYYANLENPALCLWFRGGTAQRAVITHTTLRLYVLVPLYYIKTECVRLKEKSAIHIKEFYLLTRYMMTDI